MSDIYYADYEMDQEEKDINNRIAELVGFKCHKKLEGKCDGKLVTRCGACGGYGHANCYGNGQGPIRLGCCQVRPNYTQSIEEAWKLLSELDDYLISIVNSIAVGSPKWKVYIYKSEESGVYTGEAEWPAIAICKAYVKVKETK